MRVRRILESTRRKTAGKLLTGLAFLALVLSLVSGRVFAASPTEQSSSELTGTAPLKRIDVSNREVLSLRWRKSVVVRGLSRRVLKTHGVPALSTLTDTAFVAQGEGDILAYDLNTQQQTWRYSHGIAFSGAVSIVSVAGISGREVLLASADDGGMVALRTEDGKWLWTTALEGVIRNSALQVGNDVIVATDKDKLVRLSLKTGEIIWASGVKGSRGLGGGLRIEGHARPVLTKDKDAILGAFSDGSVRAFEKETGKTLWVRRLAGNLHRFHDANATPVVFDTTVFVATFSGGVYALNSKTGETLWHREAGAVVGLLAYDDMIIAASGAGYIWAFENKTGKLRYRSQFPPSAISSISSYRHLGVMTGGKLGLLVFDLRNGRPLQASAYGDPFTSAPAWLGRDLVLLSEAGYLYAFRQGEAGRVR